MGYLFYADLLGTQSLLQHDWRKADAALAALHEKAKHALSTTLSGGTIVGDDPECKLVIFNDSVFFYGSTLQGALAFASCLALDMFLLSEDRGGPLGLRGSIAPTTQKPLVIVRQDENVQATRLVTEDISGALVADKRKVLGARIVFRRSLLDDHAYREWDPRIQAKLMFLGSYSGDTEGSVLRTHKQLQDYCDVAWMNTPSADTFKAARSAAHVFAERAAFGERSALHAAATLALHQVTARRRHGLCVLLKVLWKGVTKGQDVLSPEEDDYESWLKLAQEIKRRRDGQLYFPIEMAAEDGIQS